MVARGVFLDRDGVLTANVERDGRLVAPTTLADFRLLAGVEEGVRRLKDAGFVVVVVTNQPDVTTGRTTWATLDAMHDILRRQVAVDDIRICPHVDGDGCACRKPKPGLLLGAAAVHRIALNESFVVGDRWRDVGAGKAAGCATILVVNDGVPAEPLPPDCRPDLVAASLPQAVDLILHHRSPGAFAH
jgi:D-glycero-D-manno-heptose 1,7-bisphosphate phosphatase